jgi:5'-methylthioadenosine phosphorylase
MSFDIAIIGGTGVGKHLMALEGVSVHIPTHEGTIRGKKIVYREAEILLMSRHSAGHKVPPHRVNYIGMATALQQLGVKFCLASAAVGCLRKEWQPGTFVACSDFLDFTFRNLTMFDANVVHTDFTHPFSPKVRAAMIEVAAENSYPIQPEGIYLCGNGPRYETPEEIRLYDKLGADLVGMTASTEAIVMREAGVDYGCLAVVTNMAAGLSEHELSHQEVEDEMNRSGLKAVDILLGAAVRLAQK